jgi:predicted dehydrogenase
VNVGLIGCGVIAHNYVKGSAAFPTFDIVACADVSAAVADAFGEQYDLRVLTPEELVADPDVEIVLSLTPPLVHAEVASAALANGKHVHTEKPLATELEDAQALVCEASSRGLRIGCAPDTFLGSPYEAGREAIERGDIGEPLGATARFLVGGPDTWHPQADMFYKAGAGPLLDIGPYYLAAMAALLGPYTSAVGFASTPTPVRRFGVGPHAGDEFTVDVPTYVVGALQLESGGVATLTTSFEATGQYESSLVVHGSEGALELPDANAFTGDVRLRNGRGEWETVAYASRGDQDTRGIGLHEMVESMEEGRPHRASGDLGLHVLEAAHAILAAAEEGRTVEIESRIPTAQASAR